MHVLGGDSRRGLGRAAAFALALIIALVGGCAVQAPRVQQSPPVGLPPRVELVATPFFAQEEYLCGPAALATVLGAAGLPATPETLAAQIFLPARKGTLQLEMLAGARRHGAVAIEIPGTLEAVMRETAAGRPVVVLQNLGLGWAPAWHYAVVVGYDLERGEMLLRSGTTAREVLALTTFEHTWKRSGFWAFVAVPPGQLAATATEEASTRALVAFERSAAPQAAVTAYAGALERWPDNLTLAIGLGNARYARGDKAGAERAFRAAAERHRSAAALNNLATVQLELGRRDEARAAAQAAVDLGGPLRDAALATLRAIEAAAPR